MLGSALQISVVDLDVCFCFSSLDWDYYSAVNIDVILVVILPFDWSGSFGFYRYPDLLLNRNLDHIFTDDIVSLLDYSVDSFTDLDHLLNVMRLFDFTLNLNFNNLLNCNRNFDDSLNQNFFVDDSLMSLLLELRNINFNNILSCDWVVFVDDILNRDFSNPFHWLRSFGNVSCVGWIDLVNLNVVVDVLWHWDFNNLLNRDWILNDVVDSLLNDVVNINRAFNDVLNWLLKDVLFDDFIRNWSLNNVLDIDWTLNNVLNWLFDHVFDRNLNFTLDDVINILWFFDDVLDWALDDPLDRNLNDSLARNIDDLFNDVLVVYRIFYDSVLFMNNDFCCENLSIWVVVQLIHIHVKVLIVVDKIFMYILDHSFHYALVWNFNMFCVLNRLFNNSFDWNFDDFFNWNLDSFFNNSLHYFLDFDFLLDDLFDRAFNVDIVLNVNVAFVRNFFFYDDFDLLFDKDLLDDWFIFPSFNRPNASSCLRPGRRNDSLLEPILSDVNHSLSYVSFFY